MNGIGDLHEEGDPLFHTAGLMFYLPNPFFEVPQAIGG
jgi:hypothetical protein